MRRVASDGPAEPVDRTAKLKALLEANKAQSAAQNDALDRLRNGAKNIFGKSAGAAAAAKPDATSPGSKKSKEDKIADKLNGASQILQAAKAQVQGNTGRKIDFVETLNKISSKGKPQSPRARGSAASEENS